MSSSRMGVKGVKRVPARGAPADQQNALLEDYTKRINRIISQGSYVFCILCLYLYFCFCYALRRA